MEQNIQQSIEKKLPIKIKIVALLMILIGIYGFIQYAYSWIFQFTYDSPEKSLAIALIAFYGTIFEIIPSALYFLSGFFLLKRKKWARTFAMITLFISLVLLLFSIYFFSNATIINSVLYYFLITLLALVIIIPLIILLVDKKKYLDIVS